MFRRLSTHKDLSGFAGLDGLHHPSDFMHLAKAAAAKANGLIGSIGRLPPGPEVVDVMDEISDSVCRVADVANFCQCVHPDSTWRQHASSTLYSLIRYISKLNTNDDLFGTLKTALDRRKSQSIKWSDESSIVGESLFRDFISCGMGHGNRDVIERIIQREHTTGMEFQRCATEHKTVNALKLTNDHLLPLSLRQKCSAYQGVFYLAMTPGHVNAVLQSTESEDVRKAAFLSHFQSIHKNVLTLTDLLKVRMDWASSLGWESYAHFKQQDSIAAHPKAVLQFLKDTADDIKPKADAEMHLLQLHKGGTVHQWDIPYWISVSRQSIVDGYRSSIYSDFHLQNVINGISQLLFEFMNIEMIQLDSVTVWDNSVHVCVLKQSYGDTESDIIGHLYMDLMSRPHKRPENAHYTLRCGRQLSDGHYVTPIVALVTHFSSTKLGFFELRTLMHEFGHVLHSILCKTKYQHLFGTRGPLDLVEIPSHFFERLIQYPEVLRYLAGVDRRSHKPIAEESLQNLIHVHSMFSHLRLQEQLHVSIVDQILHSSEFHEKNWTTSDVMEHVQNTIGSVPFVPNTYKEAWLTHLTSYGARYYSYIYSRCIADMAWDRHMSGDVFNKDSWTTIRTHLFQPGGAIHPQQYVWNLIGSDRLKHRLNGWIPCQLEKRGGGSV